MVDLKDTIVALSSPSGSGAIAMIRMSGNDSISIIDKFVNKNISNQASHTAHFVVFKEGESIIDECVVTLFKSP
ncbi:MAG: tRNA uridine-5-carboxymethylaminomethyl(34) synthesis GTPase MnmE, partial [Saprospiraceae bacterium]|nr:tRNA uridine-5-carboxymethylaminomethyl(34) synthesis GTPase MnmE [Saprospiraceae bacterium]